MNEYFTEIGLLKEKLWGNIGGGGMFHIFVHLKKRKEISEDYVKKDLRNIECEHRENSAHILPKTIQ